MSHANRIKSTLVGTALVLGVGAGGFGILSDRATAEARPAPAEPAALPVAVAVMEENPVRLWSDFSARLQAVDEVTLRPEVSGRITEVRFEDGAAVAAGEVLFVIDPRPYQAAVALAEADLAAARERSTLASKELKRAKALGETKAISKRLIDESQSAYGVALSEVKAAEARLAQARLDLDHAHIKAPIGGRVGRAELTAGNLVQAGPNAPVLTTIVSSSGIYADFEVDETTYLTQVHGVAKNVAAERHIPVRLRVNGVASQELEGRIHTFDNRIDSTTGTIRARALFDNAAGTLLPGMFAQVLLGSATEQKAILVPERAIQSDQNRKFVYVVGEDSRAAYREVGLGASVGDHRVVTSGLRVGDGVIMGNTLAVRPNTLVAPQPQEPARAELGSSPVQVAAVD